MAGYLLVLTDDGYAKRIPLEDIPFRRPGAKGVRVSSVPVAAAMKLDGDDGDVVIATATGKVERLAISSIPVRHRRVQSGGRMAKGARVVHLAAGDRVTACAVAQCPPATLGASGHGVPSAALQEGDTVAATLRLAS